MIMINNLIEITTIMNIKIHTTIIATSITAKLFKLRMQIIMTLVMINNVSTLIKVMNIINSYQQDTVTSSVNNKYQQLHPCILQAVSVAVDLRCGPQPVGLTFNAAGAILQVEPGSGLSWLLSLGGDAQGIQVSCMEKYAWMPWGADLLAESWDGIAPGSFSCSHVFKMWQLQNVPSIMYVLLHWRLWSAWKLL